VVVSCGALAIHVKKIAARRGWDVEVRPVPPELHNRPEKIRAAVAQAANGDDVVVEPYLITLKEEAETYTGFQHAGTEFIYMLTGEVIYRHGKKNYRLRAGDSILFDSGALHGPEVLVKRPMTYLSIIVYPRRPA